MYPITEVVETKGFYKQTRQDATGRFYEIDPCVLLEEVSSHVGCADCGKFMTKMEIDYDVYHIQSYHWLDAKLEELRNTCSDKIQNLPKSNELIRLENVSIAEDNEYTKMVNEAIQEDNERTKEFNKGKPKEDKKPLKDEKKLKDLKQFETEPILRERLENSRNEAITHGRANWLKNTLRELIKTNDEIREQREEAIERMKRGREVDQSIFEKGIKCMQCRA